MTERVDGHLTCHACQSTFPYRLIHDGFNQSAHGYCDRCGRTLLLDLSSQRSPDSHRQSFGPITRDVEATLEPCACGGSFTAGASPRCPGCQVQLSAALLQAQIEVNARGTAKGWRWQNSWRGIHAIIINEHHSADSLSPGA
jgi:Fe-S oxidoreductase